MSQQPKVVRIVGSGEQVVSQLQQQCPDLAHMLTGSLVAMAQTGSRQVTIDFNRSHYQELVEVTVSEDSITIKRGECEPKPNDKIDKASQERDGRSLQNAVVNKEPKTRHARPHERRKPKRARRVENA